jgi:hypothetical protein
MSILHSHDLSGAPLASADRPPSPAQIREARRIGSHRRWACVSIVAVAILLALVLQGVSARTALMLGGSLLTFALAAERLDQTLA